MKTKPAALRISYRNADFEGEISQNKVKSRGFAFFSSGNSYYGKKNKKLNRKQSFLKRRMEKRLV